MKHEKIWKYGCFLAALILVAYGVYLARIDAVLRGACKKQLHHSRFATYGLYLFCLIAAALMLYAVWLWVAEAVKKKQILCTTVLAVCMCAFLAMGYQNYHAEVYQRSTVSAQKKYQMLYEKGLFYDLKSLFR